MAYQWIKLYHEILHDPKMARLPDHLWRRAIELFLLAGENEDNGRLPCIDDMTWTLRASADDIDECLQSLMDIGIVHEDGDGRWIVSKFAKRQAAIPVAERVSQKRQRDQRKEYYADEEPPLPQEPPECNDPDYADTGVDVTERYIPVTEALPERYLDKNRKDKTRLRQEGISRVPRTADDSLSDVQRQYLALFGAKRFKNNTQRDALRTLEDDYGGERLLDAARWAATKGMALGDAIGAIQRALPKWGNSRDPTGPPGASGPRIIEVGA